MMKLLYRVRVQCEMKFLPKKTYKKSREVTMRINLENEHIKVEFESFGAEIKSIVKKATGQEYMWSADPVYWGKTAPFLFPFIGKLMKEEYQYEGKAYPADKHGFGQRVDYEVLEQSAERIVFRTKDTEETFAKYPFHFELDIEYILGEDNVQENWYVKNTGENTMYFSIGGHAAFACPLKGISRIGQKVKLYGAEHKTLIFSLRMNEKGLITDELQILDVENGIITIDEQLFSEDALIFDGEGLTALGLCDETGQEYVRVECDAPVWGIWSMPDNNASYVCLEPWYGICDYEGFEGEISERPYTNVVESGETWKGGNVIRVI